MDNRHMPDYELKWSRKVLPMVANNAPLEHIVGRMTRYFFSFYYRGGADKCTLLHAAAIAGRLDIVRTCFQHRSDSHVQDFVNARDSTGHTALMLAVKNGQVDVVKELVEHGADVRVRDREGHDVWWMAVERVTAGSVAALKYLVDGDVEDFSSHFAYFSVHTYLYAGYLGEGTSVDLANVVSLVNIGVPPEVRFKFMKLALIAATHNDKLDVVQYLVTCGVDVNHVTKHGLTALGIALSNNIQHPDVAAYLCALSDRKVEMGNLDLGNHGNVFNLLTRAVRLEKWQIVKYFVELGEDCSIGDGRTILQVALEERQLETVSYLITQPGKSRDHGNFDLESVDEMGRTVTMWASQNGGTHTVSYFLESGADITRVDKSGGTALSLAVEAGKVGTAEFLCRQPDVASCVTSAAAEGRLSTVRFAVKEGFDVNSLDRAGRTALGRSVEQCQVELVMYLCTKVPNVTVGSFGEFVSLSNLLYGAHPDKTNRRNLLRLAEIAIPGNSGFGKSRRTMLKDGLGELLYERFSSDIDNICENELGDTDLIVIAKRMKKLYVSRGGGCSINLFFDISCIKLQ
ncbi:hypothetical protein ACHWQZ_G001455 [Mnemiopsis leidyi]